MTKLLHLDFSPRGAERSLSRRLSEEFVTAWRAAHPDAGENAVTYRDLGQAPVPIISESWIAARFTPVDQQTAEQRATLAVSNALIEDLIAHDRYVFGMPMHNFTVPTSFRAYIDHVVQSGRTWAYDPAAGPKGLLTGKRLVVITARGLSGYGPGGAMEQVNFQDPFIRAIFGFLGVTDITFLHGEGFGTGDAEREQGLAAVRSRIPDEAARL